MGLKYIVKGDYFFRPSCRWKRFALEQSFVEKWRQQVCSFSFQTLKPIPVNLHQQGRGNVLNFKQLKLHP